MRSRSESQYDSKQGEQFARLLNHLFVTRLAPSGRPYTLTEVSKATGLAIPYLSTLRKGIIAAVPFQRVVALARFFHVPLDYFDQEGPSVDTMNEPVQDATDATAKPIILEVTLRAGKVGETARALVLQMLEHAEQVLAEIDTSPATRSEENPRPPYRRRSRRQKLC